MEKNKKHHFSKKQVGIFIIVSFVLIVIGVIIFNMVNLKLASPARVRIETNYGTMIIELYEKEMPITTGNFKKLVQNGFYDKTIFHRVIDGFMIQGGDPLGTGTGGPGYTIKDEFTKTDLDKNSRGTISMANAGPNTGGSQFFINLVNNNFLDGKHPVFGKVVEGMNVIDDIAKTQTNRNDRPLQMVTITKATIL